MANKSQTQSQRLAETISKFQDQIQDTKFAIATLRIESAFRIFIKIFKHKELKYQIYFLERLKDNSNKKIAIAMQRPIDKIFETVQRIKQRNLLKSFIRIKVFSQTIEKQIFPQKRMNMMINFSDSRKKIVTSQNSYQMSNQEMQEQCIFLKDQIKKIQKSFQDFYNNLQKH